MISQGTAVLGQLLHSTAMHGSSLPTAFHYIDKDYLLQLLVTSQEFQAHQEELEAWL